MNEQTKIALLERQIIQLKDDVKFLNTLLADRDRQIAQSNKTNAEVVVEDFIEHLRVHEADMFAITNSKMEHLYEDRYQELQEWKGDWFCKHCDTQEEVWDALDLFDEKMGTRGL